MEENNINLLIKRRNEIVEQANIALAEIYEKANKDFELTSEEWKKFDVISEKLKKNLEPIEEELNKL